MTTTGGPEGEHRRKRPETRQLPPGELEVFLQDKRFSLFQQELSTNEFVKTAVRVLDHVAIFSPPRGSSLGRSEKKALLIHHLRSIQGGRLIEWGFTTPEIIQSIKDEEYEWIGKDIPLFETAVNLINIAQAHTNNEYPEWGFSDSSENRLRASFIRQCEIFNIYNSLLPSQRISIREIVPRLSTAAFVGTLDDSQKWGQVGVSIDKLHQIGALTEERRRKKSRHREAQIRVIVRDAIKKGERVSVKGLQEATGASSGTIGTDLSKLRRKGIISKEDTKRKGITEPTKNLLNALKSVYDELQNEEADWGNVKLQTLMERLQALDPKVFDALKVNQIQHALLDYGRMAPWNIPLRSEIRRRGKPLSS